MNINISLEVHMYHIDIHSAFKQKTLIEHLVNTKHSIHPMALKNINNDYPWVRCGEVGQPYVCPLP